MVDVKPCWYENRKFSHGTEMCDPDDQCSIYNDGNWEAHGQIFEGMPDFEP